MTPPADGADERRPRRLDRDESDNRVKVGFFSLTHASPTGDDRPYLDWHQLDHMPEQYLLPGMVIGQRWASSVACRQARAVETEGWADVDHAVCYLMGEPVDATVDAFLALGQELTDVGRYPVAMPSQYRGAMRLVQATAAPRVLISDAVVPFRPYRGVYLIVEEFEGSAEDHGAADRLPEGLGGALVDSPGVAGVWVYSTAADLRRQMFTPGRLRVSVCYLDEAPVTAAGPLGDVVEGWEERGGVGRVRLAAPFESIVSWDWDRPSAR